MFHTSGSGKLHCHPEGSQEKSLDLGADPDSDPDGAGMLLLLLDDMLF